jgi:hypothetical protein
MHHCRKNATVVERLGDDPAALDHLVLAWPRDAITFAAEPLWTRFCWS